jgi:hypothetical protein
MCRLKVVLFAKGRGSDASTYRPNRDDSQWWNRRDALVRCVAAFLFGPNGKADHRELVILFDEDLSRMHMTYRQPELTTSPDACLLIPSEQTIVSLWKKAASQGNGEPVEIDGLTCRLASFRKDESQVSGMDSKRDVLEFLQKACSLEFLRQHGLNSTTAVILRKTNKKTLMNVWSAWKQQDISKESGETSTETLESILEELLQPDSPLVEQVVAGVLHESSENELPCWKQDPQLMPSMQVCLFLGAVRDMSSAENRCLGRLCDRLSIPLAKVRLGPVPEFTSKILTVTCVHHAQDTLGPAILRLVEKKVENRKRLREEEEENPPNTSTLAVPPVLNFICLVPFASSELSCELSDRTRALWCLVRCTVVSLWRSRLAGGKGGNTPLRNRLTLVFEDGQDVTLEQDELVTSLAEQHQAAPSENQILKALQAKLGKADVVSVQDWKTRAVAILNGLVKDSMPRYILNTEAKGNGCDLSRLFCSMDPESFCGTADSVWVLISMGPRSTALEEMEKGVVRACRKMKVPIIHRPALSSPCQDREAATITMIQHFCYQNRLFGMLRRELDSVSQSSEKKMKKRSSSS